MTLHSHQTHVKLRIAAILVTAVVGSTASASFIYGVNQSGTSTTLHGGDRELNTLSFSGSSTIFTGANLGIWADGSMSHYINGALAGPYGWNDPISRDMSTSGNLISGNPDRADNSTPFAGEAGNTGTLREVFGTDSLGYKNLSWIIDGEKAKGVEKYTLDLYFTAGMTLSADADDSTVEFALLERGRNSDVRVYGINNDGSLTGSLFIPRNELDYAGWKLNTLEIGDNQKVGGVGISLDSSWTNLKGFRLEMFGGSNGMDIVAVGADLPVPAPAAVAVLGVAGLIHRRRRRSA